MKRTIDISFNQAYLSFIGLILVPFVLAIVLAILYDNFDPSILHMLISSTYQVIGAGLLLIATFKSHIFDSKIKREDKIEHKEMFKLGVIMLLAGLSLQALAYHYQFVNMGMEFRF